MRNIIVYRHQLFLPSEVFITQQAQALTQFNPIYVGRKEFGMRPDNSQVVTLATQSKSEIYSNILFRRSTAYTESVREYCPVLIHAHFGVEGVYAMELANELRIPLVTTFHGFDATTTGINLLRSRKPAWINYYLFRNKLAREGSLFICVSEYIRQKVLALGFPEERTVRHYIGIDTDKIRPGKTKSTAPVILHVARLVEKKGTRFLIKAFSYVAEKFRDAQLVIIGEGPLREELEKLQHDLGLAGRISFLGVQPHAAVLDWMKEASVFCLPSVTARSGDSEGLGMVLLEAAATGVPVVATNHGGIPEVVDDGVTGFLVEERDYKALAERLMYLLGQDSLRERMGAASRRMVEERFDIKCQTKKLEDMYEKLL